LLLNGKEVSYNNSKVVCLPNGVSFNLEQMNKLAEYIKGVRKLIAPHWTDLWPEIVTKAETTSTIVFGSGTATRLNNAVHVDINPLIRPDIICNLNDIPYPFKSDTYEVVIALSILEHLDDFFGVMGEIHRIARNSASVYILVPHFSSAGLYVDPSHRQHLSARSCDYFIEGTSIENDFGFYVPYRYRLINRHIELLGIYNYILPLRWLVSRSPGFWEEYLCYIIRGKGIFWELQVIK
jgi:SAM-dependent methyltransferase